MFRVGTWMVSFRYVSLCLVCLHCTNFASIQVVSVKLQCIGLLQSKTSFLFGFAILHFTLEYNFKARN